MTWRDDQPKWKAHVDAIRQLLLVDWDPIGGGGGHVPEDEYDGYIPVIYRMMQEGVGVKALASHLGQIESERMGIRPVRKRNLRVAEALMALMQ